MELLELYYPYGNDLKIRYNDMNAEIDMCYNGERYRLIPSDCIQSNCRGEMYIQSRCYARIHPPQDIMIQIKVYVNNAKSLATTKNNLETI